ncbi:MAG: phage baseplate assembly protein [Bosea sp. (in: a-proteobacteria)]
MTSIGKHTVSVIVGGVEIDGWTSYSISTSLLTPSDAFRLTRPFDRDAWSLCRPSAEVSILIDGVALVTGYIDDLEVPSEGDEMTIVGRDKIGQLVQESAPAFSFASMDAISLISKLAAPYFQSISRSNERNRRVVRGRRGRVVDNSPVVLRKRKADTTRVEPGQMRWAVIEKVLEKIGCIAISSGDGKELIVYNPNDEKQEPQFRFFRPRPGSARVAEGNVSIGEKRSVGDYYSRIDVASTGTASADGGAASYVGTAKDNPTTDGGEGLRLLRPKKLVLLRPVRTIEEARDLARRELARRLFGTLMIPAVASMHGQRIKGGRDVTLFAIDTVATVENEMTGTKGLFRIVSCEYSSDRPSAETTRMELVPVEHEVFV